MSGLTAEVMEDHLREQVLQAETRLSAGRAARN